MREFRAVVATSREEGKLVGAGKVVSLVHLVGRAAVGESAPCRCPECVLGQGHGAVVED
ncbi:hypothetical protein [Arthrobacter cryoconiti]|uniref:Uncharacterized protein n=1 Tax=Arthrobacter cryoconiti TaxID=748907 RepID=A0ABV8R3D9_9MICC|nr:hypothetical protein [Arthrobacter cryoconiti]MCC9066878.1 hypothetical protein [Arthrobacter cryoconiti]